MICPSNSAFNRYQTGDRETHSIQRDQTPSIRGLGRNLAWRRAAAISVRHATTSRKKSAIGQFQTNPVILIRYSMRPECLFWGITRVSIGWEGNSLRCISRQLMKPGDYTQNPLAGSISVMGIFGCFRLRYTLPVLSSSDVEVTHATVFAFAVSAPVCIHRPRAEYPGGYSVVHSHAPERLTTHCGHHMAAKPVDQSI